MEQSDFDSITTRVRHLRENIAELQKNYGQLTLNVKLSGNVQQANLDIVQTSIHGFKYAQHLLWQAFERPLLKVGSPSVTIKERVQLTEPQQVFQVSEPGKADSAYTSPSSKENVHQVEPPQDVQVSKPDVSGQPSTSGVKEGETSLRPQKGPKRMYLENIHDFGHLKEHTPSRFADGMDLGHSPQFVLLHPVFGKSRNFQIGY
ncbi:hypothetical protein ACS0TY_009977 [Phlomoides rotata]